MDGISQLLGFGLVSAFTLRKDYSGRSAAAEAVQRLAGRVLGFATAHTVPMRILQEADSGSRSMKAQDTFDRGRRHDRENARLHVTPCRTHCTHQPDQLHTVARCAEHALGSRDR